MIDISEMTVKSASKIDFAGMAMLFAVELKQSRNIAKYTLKREVEQKVN